MMKRAIALILCVVMAFTVTPSMSFAADEPVPFYIGNAMRYGDTGDSLTAPSPTTQLSDITMEAWVKADSLSSSSGNIRIMYNGGSGGAAGGSGYGIYLQNNNPCILMGNAGFAIVEGVALQTSQWYHLAAVRSAGGVWTFYVNGTAYTPTNSTLAPYAIPEANNAPAGCGFSVGNSTVAGELFRGSIDEVRYWTVARTAQQIRDNMYIKLQGDEAYLLAYYNFDQEGIIAGGDNTTITTVTDLAALGGNNDLTISGFARTGNTSNFVESVALGTFELEESTYTVRNGKTATVNIVRRDGSEGTVTVNYQTTDGTAIAGTHYAAVSGSVTFTEGQTEKAIVLTALDSLIDEPLTFNLEISAQSGVNIGATGSASVAVTPPEGLFSGRFDAVTQLSDATVIYSASGSPIEVDLQNYPTYDTYNQFENPDGKYIRFRDAHTTLGNRPNVAMYLYNAADDSPVTEDDQVGPDGMIAEGQIICLADEGFIFSTLSNTYYISNAAGCAYNSAQGNQSLILRGNTIGNPTLEELEAYKASNTLMEAGKLLLRFYANGANVTGIPSDIEISANTDYTIGSALNPSREGYTFLGWNTSADGSAITYAPNAVYNSVLSVSLYAQWQQSADGQQAAPTTVGIQHTDGDGDGGALTGTTAAMQYRTAEDANIWYWCTADTTYLPVGEYWVRFAPVEGYAASPEAYVGYVLRPAPTPAEADFVITNVSEHGGNDGRIAPVNTAVTYEYSIDLGTTFHDMPKGGIDRLSAGAVAVRVKAIADESLASSLVALFVMQPSAGAPDIADFTIEHAREFGSYTGVIIGADTAMEYTWPSHDSWLQCGTNGMIENLSSGEYRIRYARTGADLPSDYVTLFVKQPFAERPAVGSVRPTIWGDLGAISGTTTAMEYYSIGNLDDNGDPIWMDCTNGSTAVPSGRYQVRLKETAENTPVYSGVITVGTALPTVDGTYIFANGAALVITGNDDGTESTIYIDLNRNGVVDEGEQSLYAANVTNAPQNNTDLSEYTVFGGGMFVGSCDTMITMLSGTVDSIYGGNKSGELTGDTHVTVSGGRVRARIYGGGEFSTAELSGNTNVTISGGTVASYLGYNAYVYGGGRNAVVNGSASVTMTGGSVYELAGDGENGYVTGPVSVSISGGTVRRNVLASVGGMTRNATIAVSGNPRIGDLNSGIQLGTITDGRVTVSDMLWSDSAIYLSTSATAAGTVVVAADNARNMEASAFVLPNASLSRVDVGEGAELQIEFTHDAPTVVGNYIYGNGTALVIMGTDNTHTTIYIDANRNDTADQGELSLSAAGVTNAPEDNTDLSGKTVFGGSENGGGSYNTSIVMRSGSVCNIFGANNDGVLNGDTKVIMYGGTVVFGVYGGSVGSTGGDASVAGDTYVLLNGGTVTALLCGGGHMESAWVSGDTYVLMNGISNPSVRFIYGGGVTSKVGGNTHVSISGGSAEDVFGGSQHRPVDGSTSVDIFGGTIEGNVYGGGASNLATVGWEGSPGSTSVTISSTAVIKGSVYGGGKGTVTGDTEVIISGGTVDGDVLGGCYGEAVNGDTNVTVMGGTVSGTVYGGGESVNGVYAYGKINGSTSVFIDGGTVGNVFGNGKAAVVASDSTVSISKGTITGMVLVSIVYVSGNRTVNVSGNPQIGGGSNGIQLDDLTDKRITISDALTSGARINLVPSATTAGTVVAVADNAAHADSRYFTMNNTVLRKVAAGEGAELQIDFSFSAPYVDPNSRIYANGTAFVITGNEDGTQSTIYIDTNRNGVVDEGELSLSAAGIGNAPADNTDLSTFYVYGASPLSGDEANYDTQIVMMSGRVMAIFGGGGRVERMNGDTSVSIQGGSVTDVIGGCESGELRGDAHVTISGGTVSGDVFSGKYADAVMDGNTTVTISGGTVVRSIIGGFATGSNSVSVSGNPQIGGGYKGILLSDLTDNRITISGALTSGAKINLIANGSLTAGSVIAAADTAAHMDMQYITVTNAETEKVAVGDGAELRIVTAYDAPSVVDNNIYGNGTALVITGTDEEHTTVYIDTNRNGVVDAGEQSLSDTEIRSAPANDSNLLGWIVFGGSSTGGGNYNTQIVMLSGGLASLYGGNRSGVLNGDTYVSVSGGTMFDLYGGSLGYTGVNASVVGDTHVTLSGGTVTAMICGGGMNELAAVDGNTYVTVRGGAIGSSGISSLYGGGYAARVTGNTNVMMSGGSVDYVYGGSYQAPVDGNTSVTISGGTIAQSVYGGGESDSATVGTEGAGNTTSVTVSGTAVINGSVYGGGVGLVTGNTNATVRGDSVGGNVFGGGDGAAVTGNTNATILSGTVDGNVYGGGNYGAVTGIATAAVSGGTVGDVYGGSNSGVVSGDAKVIISGGTIGNVYGGGRLADDSTVAGDVNGSTYVNMSNGTVANVYGGGDISHVNTDSTVTVYGGTVTGNIVFSQAYTLGNRIVYVSGNPTIGGGNLGIQLAGVTDNKVTVFGALTSGASISLIPFVRTAGTSVAWARNASNVDTQYFSIADTVLKKVVMGESAEVQIDFSYSAPYVDNSIICANGTALVITGNEDGTQSTVYIDTNRNGVVDEGEQSLSSARIANAPADNADLSEYNIHGGGYNDVVSVNYDTQIVMLSGRVSYIYGGSRHGALIGDAHVTVSGGTVGVLYGGNRYDTMNGDAHVTVSGGTVGILYGGSRGAFSVNTVLTGNTYVTISGGTVSENVYIGANQLASVDGNSTLTLSGGTVSGYIFGGVATGTKKVYVSGNPKVGGGQEGIRLADVTDNLITVSGELTSGARINLIPSVRTAGTVLAVADNAAHMDAQYFIMENTALRKVAAGEGAELQIDFTYESPMVMGTSIYAYGTALIITGNEDGTQSTVYVDANRNGVVDDGEQSLFAADSFSAPADNADLSAYKVYGGMSGDVTYDTQIVMLSGKVAAIYGGSSNDSITGDSHVTVSGGTVDYVYGGGDLATLIGDSYVTVSGGTVGEVWGGGHYTANDGNATIYLEGGTVTGLVYGSRASGTCSIQISGAPQVNGAIMLSSFTGGKVIIDGELTCGNGAITLGLGTLVPADNLVIGTATTAAHADSDKFSEGTGMIGYHILHDSTAGTIYLAINRSTLVVNPNGGTWNSSTETRTFEQTFRTTKAIPLPERTGYTFLFWTQTGANGSLSSESEAAIYTFGMANGAIDSIMANWLTNAYTVAYDANMPEGASGAVTGLPYGDTYSYGNEFSLDSAPRLVGYSFGGWYTDEECTEANRVGDAGAVVSNLTAENGVTVTLYAKWTAHTDISYTVEHYLMNTDGTYPDSATQTDDLTGTADAPLTLSSLKKASLEVENGITYSFGEVGGTAVTATTVAPDGSRLIKLYYARTQYTLTVVAGEGTLVDKSGDISYYYGETVDMSVSVLFGYSWSRWASSNTALVPDSTQEDFQFNMPASDITLTAIVPLIEFSVDFVDSQHGRLEGLTASQVYGYSGKLVPNKGYALPGSITMTMGGEPFTDFTYDRSTGRIAIEAWKVSDDVVISGAYTLKDYTVTYIADGAAAIAAGRYDIRTTSFTLPTAPARTGYAFAGWKVTMGAEGGDGFESDTLIGADADSVTLSRSYGDVTLMAQWTALTYAVSYNSNGGAGAMADGTATHDVPFTLPDCGFDAPEGMRFKEWAIGAADSAVRAAANAPYSFTEATAVYAVWEELPAYGIADGANAGWTQDGEAGLAFTPNGAPEGFVSVEVDGLPLDSEDYTTSPDGGVTLDPLFLDTLAVGEHTIRIDYTDGYAQTSFTVEAAVNTPAATDASPSWLWIIILIIAAGGLVTGIVVILKKRKA